MKLKIKLQGLATQCDKDSYGPDAKQRAGGVTRAAELRTQTAMQRHQAFRASYYKARLMIFKAVYRK